MKLKKQILGLVLVCLIAFRTSFVTVCAEDIVTCAEPRWNNIAMATLSIGFDANNVGYFEVSLAANPSCTGLSGQMRLLDENGNLLASWAIYDDVRPYGVEKTYQCQKGRTYTLTFQGYAYGDSTTMFDDIVMSATETCN